MEIQQVSNENGVMRILIKDDQARSLPLEFRRAAGNITLFVYNNEYFNDSVVELTIQHSDVIRVLADFFLQEERELSQIVYGIAGEDEVSVKQNFTSEKIEEYLDQSALQSSEYVSDFARAWQPITLSSQ